MHMVDSFQLVVFSFLALPCGADRVDGQILCSFRLGI